MREMTNWPCELAVPEGLGQAGAPSTGIGGADNDAGRQNDQAFVGGGIAPERHGAALILQFLLDCTP